MTTSDGPRVALIGVMLESNRFAPPATLADVEGTALLEGEAILGDARADSGTLPLEARAFIRTMDATGPWRPEPILIAAMLPAGPLDGDVWDDFLGRIRQGLAAAGPLDAVYLCQHGAMLATTDEDPDKTLVNLARELAGPGARLVVTLDLHANLDEGLVAAADLVVAYRTNPHVDQRARGEEAALGLRLMLAGEADPKSAFIRLPLTPPSVTLLTADHPYGTLIDRGERARQALGGAVLNVSILGNFVFTDCARNGLSIVVTARHDLRIARRLAKELAEEAWAARRDFVRALTPLEEAVHLAEDKKRPPLLLADVADNPGGGGSGRTTELLAALVASGAEDVLYGSFFEPEIARLAHEKGVGAEIEARFNAHSGTAFDQPFTAMARVVGLGDGKIQGTLGLFAGRWLDLGPSAALRIEGVDVVVISSRAQTADPVFFTMVGLDPARARTVIVKSRGHFRAGFAPYFDRERILEVDAPGLTSPVLSRFDWTRLPRPVFPLDPETTWTPPDW